MQEDSDTISSQARRCIEQYHSLVELISRTLKDDKFNELWQPAGATQDSLCSETAVTSNERQDLTFERAPPNVLIQDQLGRFNLWTSSIGVFAPFNLSLDYRLREALDIKRMVLRLLKSHLQDVRSIERLIKHMFNAPLGESLIEKEGEGSTLAKNRPGQQIRDAIRDIAEDISRLHRLSNAIRKAGTSSRNSKARDYILRDSEGNNIGPMWKEHGALRLIRDKFPGLSDGLCNRLSDAMFLRRKRIFYYRSRNASLALKFPGDDPAPVPPPEKSEPITHVLPIRVPATEVATSAEGGFVQSSKLPESVLTVPRTATSFHRQEFQMPAPPSTVSTGSSAVGPDLSLLLPRQPQSASSGSHEVQCPYCGFVIPLKEIAHDKLWKNHVLRDLAPYVCLFEPCHRSDELFDDEMDWLSHMRSEHRMRWQCHAKSHPRKSPPTFNTKAECEQHFKDDHPGAFTRSRLPLMVDRCAVTSGPVFESCPIPEPSCSEPTVRNLETESRFPPSPLEKHVMGHLIYLALKCLPEEDRSEKGSSTGSCPTRDANSDDEMWSEDIFTVASNEPGLPELRKEFVEQIPDDSKYYEATCLAWHHDRADQSQDEAMSSSNIGQISVDPATGHNKDEMDHTEDPVDRGLEADVITRKMSVEGIRQTGYRIIIGVDFASTYIGVSWVASVAGQAADNIEIIHRWPDRYGQARFITWKVPSVVAYEGKTRWGFEVTSEMVAWECTKLLLDRGQKQHPSKTPEQIITDFLFCVYRHLIEHLGLRIGPYTTQKELPFEFWFTIPAIWPDHAKAVTRRAAQAAGFGNRAGDKLVLIQAPEAAAVAVLQDTESKANQAVVEPRQGVVICDCGGQMVSITTYKVILTEPTLQLEQLVIGTGDECGSTSIDRRFLEWMSQTFGSAFNIAPHSLNKLMKEFQSHKHDFGSNAYDSVALELPMPGVPNSRFYDAKECEVRIQWSTMKGFFQPTVDKIIRLVQNQMLQVAELGERIHKVVVIGGFGNSPYLLQQLQQACGTHSQIEVLRPHQPETVIVKGAALRGSKGF